jgi:hypothetical protein
MPETILWTRQFGVASEFAARPDSRKILIINEPSVDEITESNPMSLTSKQVCVPLNLNVKRARGNQLRQSPEPGAEVS